MKGAGASSTSFWLRRWSEQSRVPSTTVLPWRSARICASKAWLAEELFGVALAAAEGLGCLAHGRVEELADLLQPARHFHAASAPAKRSLDGKWQARLPSEGDRVRRRGERAVRAFDQRRANVGRDPPGLDLVAERGDHRRAPVPPTSSRAPKAPVDETAVGVVSAISEGFADNSEPCRAALFDDQRASERHPHKRGVHRLDALDHNGCPAGIVCNRVVESAVRLHMPCRKLSMNNYFEG